MPLSTAAKAALCLCPPAVMAGTVATVPAVKRAVHHLTAPHHPKHVRKAAAPAKPGERVAQREDCAPILAGPLPVSPIVTYAAPIPDEPGRSLPGIAGGSPITVLAAEAPVPVGPGSGGTTPGTPPGGGGGPGPGTDPAVPEPASWLMLIAGVGMVGSALRVRRRGLRHATAGASLWSIGGVTEAGDTAATVAMQSGAAKSALATAAGKAALCVCPAALVAGSVVAVPPVRNAVHTATAPAGLAARPAPIGPRIPCERPATVPVSATAVDGYPAVVTTVAARAAPAAPTPGA